MRIYLAMFRFITVALIIICGQNAFANQLLEGIADKKVIKFRNQIYQLKDVRMIGGKAQKIGYSYEYLPVGQNFDSWRNLITIQVINYKGTNLDYFKSLYTMVKHRPNSIMEPVQNGALPDTMYLTYFLIAKMQTGDGSVYLNRQTAQVSATGNTNKVHSDLVTELNINKVYRKIPDNTQYNVIYAERKYGEVKKAQFESWQNSIRGLIADFEEMKVD